MTVKARLAFPVFSPEGWQRMRAAAVDGERLHDSAEQYDAANWERVERHTAAGHLVELVQVDAGALIAWCRAERIPLDSRARHLFTLRTVAARDARAGHA